MTNKEIVQDMYAAFAEGDIPRLLSNVAENCQWTTPGSKDLVPTAGVYSGRTQIAQFFATLGGSIEFDSFEPRQFLADGDQVAVVGHYKARLKGSRETAASDWMMLFTLQAGKLVRFQEFYDTGTVERAFEQAKAAGI
jgi:ketosteroid isomerase-like protein